MKIIITAVIMTAISGVIAFLLTLAKRTVGNYGIQKIEINEEKTIEVEGGQSLLQALKEEKIFIPSACGGKGSCGYCKVKVIEGGGELLATEKGYVSEEEAKEHVRLSCQCKVRKAMKIQIPEDLFNVKEYHATVEKIEDVTDTIKHLVFRLEEGETIEFKPGQYVQLKAPIYKESEEEVQRAYSIASSPLEKNRLELVIGLVEGGICSTYVHKYLKEGDKVSFTGPFGDFYYQDNDREMIMVAAGTGMAPILSILKMMQQTHIQRKARFFFGAKTKADLFFLEQLKEMEGDMIDFQFIPSLSRVGEEEDWQGQRGRVTAAISNLIENGENKEAYLCGSPKMIDSIVEALQEKGIPESLIYYDKFS